MGYQYHNQMVAPAASGREVAELYSVAGTQRFIYKRYADPVTLVQLNESGEFMGSGDLTKEAARAMWTGLVNSGWSTKRMAA